MKTQNQINDALRELWNSSKPPKNISVESGLERLHEKMGIVRTDRPRFRFRMTLGYTIAVILAIVCFSLSVELYKSKHLQDNLSAAVFTVSAGSDGPSSMTLPDGTLVMLNVRSSISYNADFGQHPEYGNISTWHQIQCLCISRARVRRDFVAGWKRQCHCRRE